MVVIKHENGGNLLLPRPSFTEPKVYQNSGTHSADTTKFFADARKVLH